MLLRCQYLTYNRNESNEKPLFKTSVSVQVTTEVQYDSWLLIHTCVKQAADRRKVSIVCCWRVNQAVAAWGFFHLHLLSFYLSVSHPLLFPVCHTHTHTHTRHPSLTIDFSQLPHYFSLSFSHSLSPYLLLPSVPPSSPVAFFRRCLHLWTPLCSLISCAWKINLTALIINKGSTVEKCRRHP